MSVGSASSFSISWYRVSGYLWSHASPVDHPERFLIASSKDLPMPLLPHAFHTTSDKIEPLEFVWYPAGICILCNQGRFKKAVSFLWPEFFSWCSHSRFPAWRNDARGYPVALPGQGTDGKRAFTSDPVILRFGWECILDIAFPTILYLINPMESSRSCDIFTVGKVVRGNQPLLLRYECQEDRVFPYCIRLCNCHIYPYNFILNLFHPLSDSSTRIWFV